MSSAPFELIDVIIRAGAGAGKTTELTARVIKLAQTYKAQHQVYPHFVVTTFTRKATQELKERLLAEALKTQDPTLLDFVKSPSHLHISTIHGVLSLYLARYGSVMGLSPQLSMISGEKQNRNLKKVLRELCQKNLEFNNRFQNLLEGGELRDLMNAFQSYFRLKMHWGEIRAFSSQDFADLIASKSKELEQMILPFAADILGSSASNESWALMAAFCQNQMMELESSKDLVEFWSQFISKLPSTRKTKETPPEWLEGREQIKKALEYFESWRNQRDFWQQHAQSCEHFQFCAEMVTEVLLAEKLSSGEITMEDLENLSLKLIRQNPETAQSFSRSWTYWLVDEYQDTSPSQVELLQALIGERKSFVVGDPQQSIYLFRGARAEVFREKERQVQISGGTLGSKMINYRSQPELLMAFNYVFIGMSEQFSAMTPRTEPMTLAAAVDAGKILPRVIEILICPENKTERRAENRAEHRPEKKDETENGGNDESEDLDFEIEAVLLRCQELIQTGVALEKICVLSKSNQDLENIGLRAKELGIPVQVHSSGGFFERREIIDALTLLKFICNPHDNLNFLQLLRSPAFRVPDQIIYESSQSAGASYWCSFVERLGETQPSLNCLRENLELSRTRGIGSVWAELLVSRGYFLFAHEMDSSGRREANLWKLLQMVRMQERRPGFSYLQFLKELESSADTEEMDQADAVPVIEPQRIHLMTVHASKGLQFAHIIISRMGKLPPPPRSEFFMFNEEQRKWTLSLQDPEDGKKVASLAGVQIMEQMKARQREEEDRVLYVALTRAQESVTLIFNEKPKIGSWAQRLPLNKNPGLHSENHFSYLVRHERFQPTYIEKSKAQVRELRQPLAMPPEKFRLASVTEILEANQSKADKKRDLEIGDIEKALTGVEVHRLFETLKYHWLRNPQFDWTTMLAQISPRNQKALRYLMQDQNGLWASVIKNGEVEYGFSVLHENQLIQGQIDLWGKDDSGKIWIVDYKTGSPQFSDKAFRQLKIYAWALNKMKKLNPRDQEIQLGVIYPFAEKTLIQVCPVESHASFISLSERD